VLFQTLDDKTECVGIYLDNNVYFDTIPDNLTHTWSYSPYLKGKDIQYASLYVENKSIKEICPDHLKNDWENINNRLKAFLSSFIEAKISLKDNCFFDLVPQGFLKKYCKVKNNITEYIFNNYQKPLEYNFFSRFNELLTDISFRSLNLDFDGFQKTICNEKDLSFYQKMLDYDPYIKYNMYGTITGRITTEKNSFPVHTFPKTYRHLLKPKNDWFISFDMNAAELRTSLALIEKDLPDEDLHEMIRREVFKDEIARSEAKSAVTAWLYNSTNPIAQQYNNELDNMFHKEELLNTYWDGKYVYTPYNRKIESDSHNAISHLNQSTFIDLFHRQVLKIDDYLSGTESFVSFLLHDEFVLDVTDSDKHKVMEIAKILQDTELGKFLVNIKAGKDFGNMKKLNLKV